MKSWDRFVERLKQIYEEQPRADTSECYVGLKTFSSSSIDIEFWGYFNVYGYEAHVRVRHAFIGDVIDLAKEVGVSFAFPDADRAYDDGGSGVSGIGRMIPPVLAPDRFCMSG